MGEHTSRAGGAAARVLKMLPAALAAWCATSTALGQTLPPPPVSPAPVLDYEYDANGNRKLVTQAKGVANYGFKTQSGYDSLDRLSSITDARNKTTKLDYDGRENVKLVTDPLLLKTEYQRNGLGDIHTLKSPDTGTAAQTYDDAGNLKTRLDNRGVLATYGYDALNRLKTIVYTKGTASRSVGWAYDETGTGFSNGVGRLTSTTHPDGRASYAYDPQGRLIRETQVVNAAAAANLQARTLVVGYTYENARLGKLTYPSGRVLSISYTNGQPSSLTLARNASDTSPTALISGIQYEPFGPVKSWQWQASSGAVLHQRVYDGYGRLVRYWMGNVVRDISYDPADRITQYKHYDAGTGVPLASWDQGFGYDELGRLTTVSANNSNWSIAYDDNGNRKSVILNGVSRTYNTVAGGNRLGSITNPLRRFGYDEIGNVTSDGYTAVYDLAGRMATLIKAGVNTTYTLDGLGKRVRKYSSSGRASTVLYAYDSEGRLLGEYDNTGAALREYVWFEGQPIAVFTPDPTGASKPPLVYFVHADHLGAPRMVLDRANALRWRWLAEPWGTNPAEDNPASLGAFALSLRLPGQIYDAESGLHYNYFRDYDATIGRYVQSDPIGLAGGINTYAYVGGNPISEIDPLGLAACVVNFPDYPIDTGFGFTSSNLGGHGGVLSYDSQGSTRYYEYGRYSPSNQYVIGDKRPELEGNVRRVPVPDLVIDPKTGQPTPASLEALRKALSDRAGHKTRTDLTCDQNADETKVNKWAEDFAKNSSRPKYSWKPWSSNQCRDFANRAYGAGR